MNYITVLAFVVLQLLALSSACGPNEVPTDCLNPCQPTCQRPTPSNCQFLVCNEGCICAPGYILNKPGGRCVPVNRCRRFCGRNQIFTQNGSACPPTCEEPEPEVCIEIAVTGCFCKEGYLLRDNQCVKPRNC